MEDTRDMKPSVSDGEVEVRMEEYANCKGQATIRPLVISYVGHYTFVDNVPRPMHQHRGAELVYYSRGQCMTRTVGGEELRCTAVNVLVMPPQMKHIQYANTKDCETLYVVFEPLGIPATDLVPRLIDVSEQSFIQSLPGEIFRFCQRGWFDLASHLLSSLWLGLRHQESSAKGCQSYPLPLRHALTILAERYHEPLPIESLASECCVSASLLTQLFRRHLHMSPRQVHIAVRMRQARHLLVNPDYNVTEVAEQLGFTSVNYFIRQFRQYHGVTPHQYCLHPAENTDRVRQTQELYDF